MKAAGEGEWPGDAHAAVNLPAGGPLGTADDPDHGGLAGPVAAEDADFFTWSDAQVDII